MLVSWRVRGSTVLGFFDPCRLSALPNVMSVLTTSVQTIQELRVSLHGVEAALGVLEILCDDVDLAKSTEHNKHVGDLVVVPRSLSAMRMT